MEGYTFGRRGSLADHLGPWMARTEDVAATLLDEFLRRSGRELVFVDCMLENPWALPLVKARGFEFSRPLTRMFRGREHTASRAGPELASAPAARPSRELFRNPHFPRRNEDSGKC